MKLELKGDWNRAGIYMRNLAVKLKPSFEAQLYEDGELVLKEIRQHIDKQDLNWTPLSPYTIELKGGDDTIYIDTGTLYNGMSVRRVKSTVKGSTIFIGASPWKKHAPSGKKLSDLMIWLEYGTDKIPPRPLMEPTQKEVEDLIKKGWRDFLKDLIERG